MDFRRNEFHIIMCCLVGKTMHVRKCLGVAKYKCRGDFTAILTYLKIQKFNSKFLIIFKVQNSSWKHLKVKVFCSKLPLTFCRLSNSFSQFFAFFLCVHSAASVASAMHYEIKIFTLCSSLYAMIPKEEKKVVWRALKKLSHMCLMYTDSLKILRTQFIL